MADFGGYLVLDKTDMKKDALYIYGDKKLIGMILCLVDPALVIEPSISNDAERLKIIKNPPKNLTLSIGDKEISKDTLINTLQFAGIIK